MFKRKYKKQSRLKRFLLKLFNIYAFEKETFNIINPHFKNDGKNFYNYNDKTFLLSSGFLDLKRKIKKIDIFIRYSPSINLWKSTGSWKRIVQNVNKQDLIKICLLSLKDSILNFLNKHNVEFNLHLIHDGSNEKFNDEILKIVNSDKYNSNLYQSKVKGNRGSYIECCDQAEKAEDIIFFIEDDYLFEKDCIEELIFTYSRISTLLNQDIFLCPSDYPFYYDSVYETALFIGKEFRWRYVKETLLTIMFSKEVFLKNKKNIRLVGEKINEPFEKPLDEIFNKVPCLAPIKSTAYHLSRSVPAINEDWLKLWKKYYDIINTNK
tara:strand:- start:2060 stop:3028 length:969 start_codon:yes stop_codon:yes gene_type:complete